MEQARQWMPYCGAAPDPQAWLGRWNLDPVLGLALALMALALWWPRAWLDAPAQRRRDALRWAWALAAVLYISPLCALGSAFFTARVVHDMVLVFVLAPLLAFGGAAWLRHLPVATWTSTALAAAAFWVWHAPSPYAAALSSGAVFWAMQLTLLGSATVFWSAVARCGPALALAAVLASTVSMGLLGALITFAARPLYAPHAASTLAWGVSPLDDQQLAGIVMWAPGSIAYLAAALWIGWRWLREGRDLRPHAGPA